MSGGGTPPPGEERLALDAAHALLVNGEDTSGVLAAGRRLGDAFGRDFRVEPRWDEIRLMEDARPLLARPAVPWAVNMRRVTETLALVEGAPSRAEDLPDWGRRLAVAAALPAYGDGLFAFACMFGSFALTFLNGAQHVIVPVVAAMAAGIGALARRWLAKAGGNDLAQLFAATLIAGALGATATRFGVGFGTGLVVLGPLFVLVPGPALMGGAFDCAALRLSLGLARIAFGLICIAVLCSGVLIGSAAAGGLMPDPQMPETVLPIWEDMLCAAAASAAYAIFFVMPLRMIALPVVMGALAHGLRWVALNQWHVGTAAAAGLGCLLVGMVVGPLSRRWRLPFAAVGFASVVAQVPGVFMFRMSGGLVELEQAGAHVPLDLIARIATDAGTTLMTLVAMALGLTLSKSVTMGLGGAPKGFAP